MNPERKLFFIGIIYSGNNDYLISTLNSITRQSSAYADFEITLFLNQREVTQIPILKNVELTTYIDKRELFSHLSKALNHSLAEYQTLITSGEEFFDGTLNSVNRIFNTFNDVKWLTGIQTFQTVSGFNIALGNTSSRRWTYRLFETNLYKHSGRYIAPASTFWKKTLWDEVYGQLHFVGQSDFIEDLWINFFGATSLYTCKVYFSSSKNYGRIENLSFAQPNSNLLIEDSLIKRIKEFFFLNNIPYLRLFYRKSSRYMPVIRFDHNSQSYFLSDY